MPYTICSGYCSFLIYFEKVKRQTVHMEIQRDPAFKKVDFKNVRHCFSEKVSSYKKVFSLKKYHFLIIS